MQELPNELNINGTLYIRQHIRQEPTQAPIHPAQTNGVMCNCGLPAEFQRGHSEKTGKDWARWVCAKPPRDPKNCGFKKWVDC